MHTTNLENEEPATLKLAMDRCITHHCEDGIDRTEDVMREEYALHLDCSILLPQQQEDTEGEPKPVNEMEMLKEMCRSKKHRHLIKHPLVQTMLYAKWRKALPFYIANVVLYFLFVVVLTVFVYFLKDLRLWEAWLSNLHHNGTTDANLEARLEGQESIAFVLKMVLTLICLYMIVREAFQMISSPKFYRKNIENYLEWLLLGEVIVLCWVDLGVDFTRLIAAWAMIFAW